jgi:4-carboxymuconolactone decarboxylase
MAEDERRRLGKAKMAEISRLPAFDPPDAYTAATTDQVFGELWQRPGLPDRDRRLITIAILATNGLEMELGVHIKAALGSGDVTPAELMEVVLQVAHYAGFPLGSVTYRAFRTVCNELGLEVPEA